MPDKCSAIARSGSRCTSPTLAGSRWCWIHDPARADDRREASRKGGKARSHEARALKRAPPVVLTADELARRLSGLFIALVEGAQSADPKTATAAANVARTIHELTGAAELAERVRELEGRITGPGGRHWGA